MPFNNNRIYYVAGFIIIICVVALIGYGAIQGIPKKTGLPGVVIMTVKGETGINYIEITNQNTDQTILLQKPDLPYSFNCTQGDELQIKVTTLSNYYFNSWRFNTNIYGSFDHHNPLYLTVDTPVTMLATVIYIEPSPSPSPTPSVVE
jgi:hypothetical protein